MPYLQAVNGKFRVRVVVPEELIQIIGQANLTKALGTGNEREAERLAIPHIAEFLRKIEGAREWTEIHQEAAAINGLSLEDILRRGPASFRVFAKLDRKMDEIFGLPVSQKIPELVTFEDMIARWSKTKGKRAIGTMEHLCGPSAGPDSS
jgi:hypothetical protein